MKKYAFFYHYNKPLSKQKGKPVISIHYRGQCLMVDNLVCNVKTRGKIRNKQPYFVVVGKASKIEVNNGIAEIS